MKEIRELAEEEFPLSGIKSIDKDVVNEREAFIKGHQKAQEWISVEDRLPEGVQVQVIGYLKNRSTRIMWAYNGKFYWDMSCRIWQDSDLMANKNVTHWMPLPPQPPKK